MQQCLRALPEEFALNGEAKRCSSYLGPSSMRTLLMHVRTLWDPGPSFSYWGTELGLCGQR